MGEVMNSLDKAMYALLEKKKQRLWELSARLDNAMIETFIHNQVEPSKRLEVDMHSGLGNCKLKSTPNSSELCA